MSANFGFLAGYALACPKCNVCGHVRPKKYVEKEMVCGPNAMVA